MLFFPENKNATAQLIEINTMFEGPNNSYPSIKQAKGVFEAPAKTATKPKLANIGRGMGINNESRLPKHAPIKNKGVTSPPLKPDESVSAVNSIFKAKSYQGKFVWIDSEIVDIPNPIYLDPKI